MACDMLWGVNILSKFQLPSSYVFWPTNWLTDLNNDEGICSTAPVTPGLLKKENITLCCLSSLNQLSGAFGTLEKQTKKTEVYVPIY